LLGLILALQKLLQKVKLELKRDAALWTAYRSVYLEA